MIFQHAQAQTICKLNSFPNAGHIKSQSGTHNKCVHILLALLLNCLNNIPVGLFTVSSE